MTTSKPLADPRLSPEVKKVLSDFLEAARNSFGDHLRSVTLFGSAAEGKLRPTSDVNLVIVLSAFEQTRADRLRQPLRNRPSNSLGLNSSCPPGPRLFH